MKNTLVVLFLSVALFACKSGSLDKTLSTKIFSDRDDFNQFPKTKTQVLTIEDDTAGFMVKFKDTSISIKDGAKPLAAKYRDARFINSQKTAVLVQIEDGAGVVAPLYIINLSNGVAEAIGLYKTSDGKKDKDYAKGIQELTLTNILINNDFLISTVRGKVYPVKRKNPSELIQGNFILYSKDKTTLVFATETGLFQVNYLTDETADLKVSADVLKSDRMVNEIQNNYTWEKNARGSDFLKPNPDNDRIVDIKEFKN